MSETASVSRSRSSSSHWLVHWPWLLLAVYWVVILTGTHFPTLAPPQVGGIEWGDKPVHFTAYAGLAFLIAGCFSRGGKRLSLTANVLIWLAVIAYGAVDELSQPHFGRSCDLFDWYADAAGAATGLVVQRAWRAWRGRKQMKRGIA